MTQTYTLNVCGLERVLPLVPINDKMAFASFVDISDTEMIEKAGAELAEKVRGAEMIMTAEAKGIPLAYEVSRRLGLPYFIVARKSLKSYMRSYRSTEVQSITTAGRQNLYLDVQDCHRISGKRVCLIDDVISTGESIKAIEKLAEEAGAMVTARAAILAEGEAGARKDIIFLEKLPLFVKGEDGIYFPVDE